MGISRRRILSSLGALTAVGAAGFGARSALARYYDGPLSDHFDGVHFFDAHGSQPKKLSELLWWYTHRDDAKWPEWAPSPYSDRPPRRVDGSALRISLVGHATILMQTAGGNILTDPVWS